MSLQLTLLNGFLRRAVKAHLAATRTPEKARREFERFAKLFLRPPPHLLHQVEPGQPELHSFSVGPVSDRLALLYFHGGAYVAGSPWTHAGMIGHLAGRTGLAAYAPAYRLAPEHPAPAAFDDALAAHAALLEKLGAPERIVLGGDSAGGGLALALLAELCRRGQRPAGAFAFSPWADMTLSAASLGENAIRDPFLPVSQVTFVRELVLGGLAPEDPRVSPVFAEFDAPPPVRLFVGSTEILRDDSRSMAAHLRAAGGQVELNEWPDAPHAWPLFAGYLPEADEAIGAVARFIGQL